MTHKTIPSKYQDSDPVPWGQTEAERIAAGLKGSEPMAIAYLSRVSSDMMPKTIETDEQLAAAITFSRLADQRLAVSTLTADSIEWRLTPLGRAVAEAIRAQEKPE